MIKIIIFEDFSQIKSFKKENQDFNQAKLLDLDLDNFEKLLFGSNLFFGPQNFYFYFNNELGNLIKQVDFFWDKLKSSSDNFWILVQKDDQPYFNFLDEVEFISLQAKDKKKNDNSPNLFLLTDAFLAGDKKTAWILLDNYQNNNVSVELVYFTIWWQIKVLYSVMVAGNESGQKTFVISKAKNAIKKFGEKKILLWKNQILDLYHNRFESELDLFTRLKKFVLEA